MPSSKVSAVTHTRAAVTQLRCPKVTPACCLSAACWHDKCAHVILHVSLHRKIDSTCIHTAISFVAGSAKSDQACMLAVHGRCSISSRHLDDEQQLRQAGKLLEQHADSSRRVLAALMARGLALFAVRICCWLQRLSAGAKRASAGTKEQLAS